MMNTILFDLDGTVLPLDINLFMKIYFDEMAIAFDDMIDKEQLINSIWTATSEMVKNIENKTNEEVFMNKFSDLVSGDIEAYKQRFDEFYDFGFMKARESVKENLWIEKSIKLLKEKGYQLVLATNPLFPMKAIHHRIKWAGFEPSDFSYIASYENNHFCKPQIKFYEEVLSDIGKQPSECIMVGNDVQEDLVAGKLGIKTYLIKDHILNRNDENIECTYEGNYEDFYRFAVSLPEL